MFSLTEEKRLLCGYIFAEMLTQS